MTKVLSPATGQSNLMMREESHVKVDGLDYRIMMQEDADEVSEFVLNYFFAVEPMGQTLNLNPERENRPWISELITHLICKGISFIVRNHEDGEIAAVCINDIERKSSVIDEEEVSIPSLVRRHPERNPCMMKIVQVLETLMSQHDLFEEFKQDTLVNVGVVCVSPHFGRRGIAQVLIRLTESLAKKLGHSVVYSEATSDYSAKAFHRAGFQCVDILDYATFTSSDDGQQPFRTMTEIHTSARLVVKELK